jgi:hypothetical protein
VEKYIVTVSEIVVYDGEMQSEASRLFGAYITQSKNSRSTFFRKTVTLLKNGDLVTQFAWDEP